MDLLIRVLPVVLGVIPLVFLGALLLLARRRAPTPAQLHSAAAPGAYVWAGQVRNGTLLGAFGRFELSNGYLAWRPDSPDQTGWNVPCTALTCWLNGMVATGPITLSGPMGVVTCTVSTEHINRISTNTLKSLRERGYARDFLAALAAHGAQVSPQ